MLYAKYQSVAAVLACGLALGIGVRAFGPPSAAAQDPAPAAAAKTAGPDIEPIDPNLVFDPEIQKQLKLSPNQVQKLTEARDQATAGAGEQANKVAAIDRRVKELQAEIERLQRERNSAQAAVDTAQAGGVKAAIPKVLSRDAVGQLRQITLQRMRLSEVLLDPHVRSRLDLNDEQVRKIQEVAEKSPGVGWAYERRVLTRTVGAAERFRVAVLQPEVFSVRLELSGPDRAELLKVLTPEQVDDLQRLSGMTFDQK